MPLLNFSPQTLGLLGDTMSGIGMGLLNQQPNANGQYSTMGGIGQGLQYAQGMQQQRRATASEEERKRIAQAQLQIAQQTAAQQQAAFQQQQQQLAAQKAAAQGLFGGATQATSQAAPGGIPRPGTPAGMSQPSPMLSGMDPAQLQFLQKFSEGDPGGALGIAAEQMFPEPGKPWQPKIETLRRGTTDEYGYWNQQNEWVPMSSGAAFAPRQDGSNEFGLNVFYTKDANGKTHAWQLSKGGGMQEVKIPEGQEVSPQTQFLDLGTTQVPVDKRTGAAVPGAAPLPVDVSGEKAAQETGAAQGQGTVALKAAEDTAANALQAIAALKTHPGRVTGTGLSSKIDPRNYLPGSQGYDFKVLLEQTKGKVFLEAFQSLKGAGAITEQEGKAGTAAIARLDAAQSEPEFLKALEELETVINQGVARAQAKAQGNFTGAPQGAVPPPPPGFEVVQ